MLLYFYYNNLRILQENHLANYDDFGNIPDTAPDVHLPISPPRHVIPQRSPSPDPLLPQPNDSSVSAPLDADERVLMEDIYTYVKRDDLRHSLAFISRMQTASLDDEDSGLSAEAITRLKFPLQLTPTIALQLLLSSSTLHIQFQTKNTRGHAR